MGDNARSPPSCRDYYYYDTAISSCTPCDHLCDQHEHQGTTKQCIEKCFKYYQRIQSTTTTPDVTPERERTNEKTSYSESEGINQDNVILTAVVSLLVLGCLFAGVLIWRMMKKKRIKCCCRGKKKRNPVQCSEEEGIDHLAESQKRLISSAGPIRQAEDNPRHGLEKGPTAFPSDDILLRTLAACGVQCTVLDQPRRENQTFLATYPNTNCAFNTTNLISTIPKTFTERHCSTSSSTFPKVIYTSEGESRDLNSSGRTVAEYPHHSDSIR